MLLLFVDYGYEVSVSHYPKLTATVYGIDTFVAVNLLIHLLMKWLDNFKVKRQQL